MNRCFRLIGLTSLGLLLSACGAEQSQQDLIDFINENKKRPPGAVKEAPKIAAYEAFTYDAYELRSPFEQPAEVVNETLVSSTSNVQPDLIRQRERLEQYDLSTLAMVGTLERNGILWALVSDPDGGIERVREGNHLGLNYGRISSVSEGRIDIIEIVANGDAWLERPNLLQIKTANQTDDS